MCTVEDIRVWRKTYTPRNTSLRLKYLINVPVTINILY